MGLRLGNRDGATTEPIVTSIVLPPQELEDDAIYSVHVPAGLYRVSWAWGRWVHCNQKVLSHSESQAVLDGTYMVSAFTMGELELGRDTDSNPTLDFRSGRGYLPPQCPLLPPPRCCHAPRKEAATR